MTGYRKMISDRIPESWDMALRYCKCRQAWIDHIYNIHVRPLNNNVMKSRAENEKEKARRIRKLFENKSFSSTINWNKLLQENLDEYNMWRNIDTWVSWFRSNTTYIVGSITVNYNLGVRGNDLASTIAEQFDIDIKLSTFFIKHSKLWT